MTGKVLKIYKGVNWILFVSWYAKLTGMLTFFILARYLNQSDFGIVAGCYIVQGFFSVLANFGTGQYLIRKKNILQEDLNVAWTINVTTRTAIATLIYILSESIADFMNILELGSVLKLMALSPFFIGLHNPALALRIKELDYEAISYLKMVAKTISSSLALFIAIYYRSYYAVVVAEVSYQAIYAVGSFIVQKYRPELCFNKIYIQWRFSKWILFKGFIAYIKYSCANIIVSRNYSLEDLGLFNFSREAASTVNKMLIEPISTIFYPSLSEYIDDHKVLVDKLYKFFMVIGFIYMPFVFGGIYLSNTIVPLLFGEKWQESIFLFDLFLAMSLAKCFSQLIANVFILIDEVKKHFIFEFVTSIFMVVFLLIFAQFSLEIFTMGRMVIAYLMLLFMLLFLSYMMPISIFTLCKSLLLPLIISSLMIVLLRYVNTYFTGINELSKLIVFIVIGGSFYIAANIIALRLLKQKYSNLRYLYDEVLTRIFSMLTKKFLYYFCIIVNKVKLKLQKINV